MSMTENQSQIRMKTCELHLPTVRRAHLNDAVGQV